ncbi:MAG: beta/alpha barrel domain-containing protein [Planctomycetota bacterium]
MASKWAECADGTAVSEDIFRLLARYAPGGTLDVFASDQHSSYLRLIGSYLEHIGQGREATDDDVTEVCRAFAGALDGVPAAALFNSLAYLSPGFRDLLGESTMLIGRLEDTNTEPVDGGRGQLARLSVEPEEVADKVDAFKTLVKLNPDHQESWKRNKDWLQGVFEKACELGKPLFNETLIFQRPGESKAQMAARLPEGVVKMAEEFGPFGHFYKTQVPVLWIEEKDGTVEPVSSPDEIRSAAVTMFSTVDRPMLLLSAAVDFEQYAAQYALVSDLVAGPMCGRAYFKEAFTMPQTRDLESLAHSFAQIALPRMRQIKGLAEKVSPPWWHKFTSMADEAKELIDISAKATGRSVHADFGY